MEHGAGKEGKGLKGNGATLHCTHPFVVSAKALGGGVGDMVQCGAVWCNALEWGTPPWAHKARGARTWCGAGLGPQALDGSCQQLRSGHGCGHQVAGPKGGWPQQRGGAQAPGHHGPGPCEKGVRQHGLQRGATRRVRLQGHQHTCIIQFKAANGCLRVPANTHVCQPRSWKKGRECCWAAACPPEGCFQSSCGRPRK